MWLGSLAGKGAVSQPQPGAGVVHRVYKAAFASWVCAPCHPALQCGVALVVMSPCACIGQPGLKTLNSEALSQSASHVCMPLSHNVNPCDY